MEFHHQPLNGASYTDADIKRLITEYNVQFIKLQFVDINGQVKNMAVPSEHIDRVLNNEIMHLTCFSILIKTLSRFYRGRNMKGKILPD